MVPAHTRAVGLALAFVAAAAQGANSLEPIVQTEDGVNLAGAVAMSPIVRQRGDATQWIAGAGVVHPWR